MEHLVKLSCEVTWRYKIYLMNFWTSRQNVENISRLILVAYKVNERKTNLEKNTHTVYRENFVGILRGQRLLRWKPELFLIPTFSSQKKILKWRHGPKIRIRSRVWPSYLLLTPFKEWSQGPRRCSELVKRTLGKILGVVPQQKIHAKKQWLSVEREKCNLTMETTNTEWVLCFLSPLFLSVSLLLWSLQISPSHDYEN